MGIYYGSIMSIKVSYYELKAVNDIKIAKISVDSLEKYGNLSKTHIITESNDNIVLSAAKAVIVEKLKLNDVVVTGVTKLLKEEYDTFDGWQATGNYVWTDIGVF